MDIDQYQIETSKTAIYPGHDTFNFEGLMYLALKINGEAGEIAEMVGKAMRDDEINTNSITITQPREWLDRLAKEIGDVEWYCKQLAAQIGMKSSKIARMNLDKLASRAERGVIQGSGDDR